jgi:hypothetical protein
MLERALAIHELNGASASQRALAESALAEARAAR